MPLLGHGIKGPEASAAAVQIYNLASSGLRGQHGGQPSPSFEVEQTGERAPPNY